MRDYGKLLWAALGAVVYFLQASLVDGTLTSDEWVGVAIAAVGAVLTWAATDTTVAPWVKSALGGTMAGLLALQTLVTQWPLSTQAWVGLVVAVFAGAGVIADPRRPVRPAQETDVRAAA
jgi:hypothetical protein